MERKIYECHYMAAPLEEEIDPAFADDPQVVWLLGQAKAHGLTTLLAHADDGVIWGQVTGGRLALAEQALGQPRLRSKTLQQLCLFGPDAELLVWRDAEGGWRGRILGDGAEGKPGWYFDEPQLQWGDHAESEAGGFTLVAEGQEGLRHAVPLTAASIPFDPPQRRRDRRHPLRLGVRHYLAGNDENGTVRIAHSRLTRLWAE